MIKMGLVSISFREFGVEKILKMCEKAQLDCIEWGGDVHVPHGDTVLAKKVAKMSTEAGIEIASYGSYYSAGASETSSEKPLCFQKVLDTALTLGTKTIRVWAGHQIKSSKISDDQRKIIVDDLLRIGKMAAKQDITIGMEFHGGTLTDCNTSAIRLKQELPDDSNVDFYWQPGVGFSDSECLDGIKALAPRISNIHTFHWSLNSEENLIRHLLESGFDRWSNFLHEIAKDGKEHAAMLEFISDNSEENFFKDAATLRKIISAADFCN